MDTDTYTKLVLVKTDNQQLKNTMLILLSYLAQSRNPELSLDEIDKNLHDMELIIKRALEK